MRRLAAVTVAAIVLAGAEPAAAGPGEYCVGLPERAGCAPADTLADALSREDRVRVFLGPRTETEPADDGGVAVAIEGAGADATVLDALELTSAGSSVSGVALTGSLRLAGVGQRLEARDGVTLLGGSVLVRTVVTGEVSATGDARLDGVVAGGLDAGCADVLARGVALRGGVTAACEAEPATVALRSSVLGGADPVSISGSATVTTAFSAHAEDADAAAQDRLEPDAGRVDAGDPAPLEPFEPFEDVDGDPRIADGDGDGVLRRDVGAEELQPPPLPPSEGNVLADPGAEEGLRGWTGDFVAAGYGEDPFLPGDRAAAALGAGDRFFSAGELPVASLLQRVDLTASAAEIDTGGATAALRGLLGGYGADADAVTVTATFRDPEGAELGALVLGPVEPAVRGNATTFVPRGAAGGIPRRTRAVDVVLRGERRGTGGEVYTDAYADRLELVLDVPGRVLEPPVRVEDPPVAGLLPFTGLVVLTARPPVEPGGRTAVRVGCPSATVGACRGTLRLLARLPGRPGRREVARPVPFEVSADATRKLRLRLVADARRALRGRRSAPARLLTETFDGQAVRRVRTVPVTLRLPRAARRG